MSFATNCTDAECLNCACSSSPAASRDSLASSTFGACRGMLPNSRWNLQPGQRSLPSRENQQLPMSIPAKSGNAQTAARASHDRHERIDITIMSLPPELRLAGCRTVRIIAAASLPLSACKPVCAATLSCSIACSRLLNLSSAPWSALRPRLRPAPATPAGGALPGS